MSASISTFACVAVLFLPVGVCHSDPTPKPVAAMSNQPAVSSHLSARVDVPLVTDEADAVLAILAKKAANEAVAESDWQRLFTSKGYARLKVREVRMGRPIDDEAFKKFVLSDALLQRRAQLAETLTTWVHADMTGAAERALAYLPKQARIRATIYPMIKPQTNSFVFDVEKEPAIFLYIDPTRTREQFENTVAHELHHIGYAASCPAPQTEREIAGMPENVREAYGWIGAFGEGFAMLAAAGGPDVHPHEHSDRSDRVRWDHDVANFNEDLKKVEGFFLDVLDAKQNKEERTKTAYSFFGIQGPWYTVGWKMSVVIEKTYGRAKLVECIRDERKLLPTYNRAVARYNRAAHESLVGWSPALLQRISGK